MAVHSLTVCQWSATDRHDEVTPRPTWDQVEAAIRRLNNAERNDLYLKPLATSSGTYLVVGGGAGRYVVTGSEEGLRSPTLSNPALPETEMVPLQVGGQLGEYPARYVVDLESTLAAVRAFYTAGGFECGIRWEYW